MSIQPAVVVICLLDQSGLNLDTAFKTRLQAGDPPPEVTLGENSLREHMF